jgi:osmotically-inducible protein OsmY
MKKTMMAILGLFFVSILAMQNSQAASGQSNDQMSKKENAVKTKKEASSKNDDEIRKCIVDKFSNSEKLKSQGFNATVLNGEAILTGTAKNAGSKGATTRIAQSCGARSVKNNITAPAIPRPKKSEGKMIEQENNG